VAAGLRRLRALPRHGALDPFSLGKAKLPLLGDFEQPDPFPIPRTQKPHH
jgi:hypothetical protein